MTLAELKIALDNAIAEHGEDKMVFVYDVDSNIVPAYGLFSKERYSHEEEKMVLVVDVK